MAEQPTVEAVLRSLHGVLSNISTLHGIELYLLSDDRKTLKLFAFNRPPDVPVVPLGTELPNTGEVARVIEGQQAIYVADLPAEMLKYPALAPLASKVLAKSAYLFPLTTSRKQYGLLVLVNAQSEEFSVEDLELMGSFAFHIAVTLETALATDRAEKYQQELARERDRLRLLLEINNHIVTKLDINDLFHSASASIRRHLSCDYAGLYLIDKESNRLRVVAVDFGGDRGSLAALHSAELAGRYWEKLRARRVETLHKADFETLPALIAETLRAQSIESLTLAPLVAGSGPLGLLAIGSQRPDAFGAALRKVLDQVAIVAPTGSTVLLHGETGTGKELFARAVHNRSPRRERTFVRLNCAAIPSGLVESELFGHEKGAFTGALMQKRGRFELADGGTLFLDEIGDISLDLQPKLLRALQEHEFERLGSTKTIHVDVRLIAATHRDLEAMIRNNQFREDLFYRLNVFPIEIPPLRERREDIPLLVHYFVSRLARRMQKRIRTIPKQAMEALVSAPWPGNVRELENFIERCVIVTQGEELKVPGPELKRSLGRTAAPASTFEEAGRQVIIDALKAASGKISGKSGAAERLGLKRSTLQHKMRKLNISRADYADRVNLPA